MRLTDKIRPLPSQERLREMFTYCPETGALCRPKKKPVTLASNGYARVCVGDEIFLAHRVVWKWVTGLDPLSYSVDHINGDKTDNRMSNLRLVVGHLDNNRNRPRNGNNKSGVTGVSWMKSKQKWRATITVNYKSKHLGLFGSKDEAIQVRKAAEAEYGFHPNHGRG